MDRGGRPGSAGCERRLQQSLHRPRGTPCARARCLCLALTRPSAPRAGAAAGGAADACGRPQPAPAARHRSRPGRVAGVAAVPRGPAAHGPRGGDRRERGAGPSQASAGVDVLSQPDLCQPVDRQARAVVARRRRRRPYLLRLAGRLRVCSLRGRCVVASEQLFAFCSLRHSAGAELRARSRPRAQARSSGATTPARRWRRRRAWETPSVRHAFPAMHSPHLLCPRASARLAGSDTTVYVAAYDGTVHAVRASPLRAAPLSHARSLPYCLRS